MSEDRTQALFFELFTGLPRQGPGSTESTLRALKLVPPLGPAARILDLGCGTGTPTLVLARSSPAHLVAIDNHAPFVEELRRRAAEAGLSDRVDARVGDMSHLEFPPASFEVIWAEGSIFVVGFERGLRAWRPLLTPGGHVAVTELTWLTDRAPEACRAFFAREYPAIRDVANNLKSIVQSGYRPVGHFTLPPSAWLDEYYASLERNLEDFRKRHLAEPDAMTLADHIAEEIAVFRAHHQHYGYVFYVMRRDDA